MTARSCIAIALIAAAVALAACGGSSSAPPSSSSHAAIPPPSTISSAGHLVFCSDISYPPEEFYSGSTPVGSDIEIGTGVAKLLGVEPAFQNTGFDGIIAALLGNKCDAIISGMSDTPPREKQVSFANYLDVGLAIVVASGNPKNITTPDDLCGTTAGGQIGTTAYIYLRQASKKCSDPITVLGFKEDTDGANALAAGQVDAYLTDAPVVAYYIKQNPSKFAFGGTTQIEPGPVGIAVRKDDLQLQAALTKAIASMYQSGAMQAILKKWNLAAFALKG